MATAVVIDDRPGNDSVPSSVPSHAVELVWSQFVAGCGEGQTTRKRMPTLEVERDSDPIKQGGERVGCHTTEKRIREMFRMLGRKMCSLP